MKNQSNNNSTQNVRVVSATTATAAELFSRLSPKAQDAILGVMRSFVATNKI